jgi:hypothetical protein
MSLNGRIKNENQFFISVFSKMDVYVCQYRFVKNDTMKEFFLGDNMNLIHSIYKVKYQCVWNNSMHADIELEGKNPEDGCYIHYKCSIPFDILGLFQEFPEYFIPHNLILSKKYHFSKGCLKREMIKNSFNEAIKDDNIEDASKFLNILVEMKKRDIGEIFVS